MNRCSCRTIKWLFFLVCAASQVCAQSNKISGVITDAETGAPIPFANVFFASTSIGVSSNMEGEFVLQNFADGKYDFVIAYVGYQPYQQAFEFHNSQFRLTIQLKVEEVRLREVVVREDTAGWAHNYKVFKRAFLGDVPNAKSCTILNPRDLHLYFDQATHTLVAHARQPLKIENRALGYTINWYLQKFELNYQTSRLEIFGIPVFENLTAKNTSEAKRWQRERQRAYEGSVTHFMRAIRSNQVEEAGFRIFEFYRVPNRKRPSDEWLNEKIKYHREKNTRANEMYISDSLRYFIELRNQPRMVDSIGRKELKLPVEDGQLAFTGMLKIDYLHEREAAAYAEMNGRFPARFQTSIMHVLVPGLKIYENGYYENAYDVFFEWYWAWSEKMSDLLPLNYLPPEKK
ncbi:MAG: carboxypeptidase-like regulatory domain-containing protein [Cyclobacteriaceae bacterium]|nr:carboxypeptidase-like regulatory domain-containing protein [Cyclobacteriaceae bacterium]